MLDVEKFINTVFGSKTKPSNFSERDLSYFWLVAYLTGIVMVQSGWIWFLIGVVLIVGTYVWKNTKE